MMGSKNRWASHALAAGLMLSVSGCVAYSHLRADQHVRAGQNLLAQDSLEDALAEFEVAVELHPQLAVAHSKMGVIFRRLGDYDRAVDSFAAAVRYNPRSFDDTINLAQLYHYTQRVRDAIQAYLHACTLRPRSFDAQLNLGVCYQQSGDHVQAIERFQRAIQSYPDQPFAYVNLGVAFDAQGKYYEAINAYREALERDNKQPLVLVNLAHTYMKQERFHIARITLEQAIKMDRELSAGHEAMGYCLFRLQDYAGATESYRTALVYDPRLPGALAGLGSISMLAYLNGDDRPDLRSEALEYWHRSLELNPSQPRVHKLVNRYKRSTSDPESILLDVRRTP